MAQPIEVGLIDVAGNVLAVEAGKEKWAFSPTKENAALNDAVAGWLGDSLRAAVQNPDKVVRLEGTNELRAQTIANFVTPADGSDPLYTAKEVGGAFDKLLKQESRFRGPLENL